MWSNAVPRYYTSTQGFVPTGPLIGTHPMTVTSDHTAKYAKKIHRFFAGRRSQFRERSAGLFRPTRHAVTLDRFKKTGLFCVELRSFERMRARRNANDRPALRGMTGRADEGMAFHCGFQYLKSLLACSD